MSIYLQILKSSCFEIPNQVKVRNIMVHSQYIGAKSPTPDAPQLVLELIDPQVSWQWIAAMVIRKAIMVAEASNR